MSGHNKWSKVKHTKGPADAKRGKLFTKLISEITVAAKMGGGSLEGNARLRSAVQTAKAASMPKENIERAIKKGTGELEGESIDEQLYEGYGPGGVAILVEAATDNKNRTVNDLRMMFSRGGGNLGESGSVAWMFTHYGKLVFEGEDLKEDIVMEVALEAGAQDVTAHEQYIEVLTEVNDVYKVKEGFDRVGMHPASTGFTFVPKTTVPISEKETAENILKFLEEIEDHDDVQRVHSNIEIDEKVAAVLESENNIGN